MGNGGACDLGKCLNKLGRLQKVKLELRDNQIGNDGLTMILNSFKKMGELRHLELDLSWNGVGHESTFDF